jgi:trehalose 2-sulfotransferase
MPPNPKTDLELVDYEAYGRLAGLWLKTVTPDQVVQALEPTVLRTLIGGCPLAFVGDRATIDALRAAFARAAVASGHEYLSVEEGSERWRSALANRLIVVSSVADEESMSVEVTRRLAAEGIDRPVLKLFADLFVNVFCGARDPLQPSPPLRANSNAAYAIVGTPRCGSEMLCDALTSTGAAGFPEEHLRLESQLLTRHCHFDCVRYFRMLRARRTTPNGVFGTKIISHFLKEHVKQSPGLRRELKQLRFIHVVRRDRVGQAISAMLASKTGVWHLRSDRDRATYEDLLRQVTIADADLRWIRWLVDGFKREDRQLRWFITRNRVRAMSVAYEDLIEQRSTQLRAMLSFLELDVTLPDDPITLKKTRSALSDQIRERYLASKYPYVRPRLVPLLGRLLLAKLRPAPR